MGIIICIWINIYILVSNQPTFFFTQKTGLLQSKEDMGYLPIGFPNQSSWISQLNEFAQL